MLSQGLIAADQPLATDREAAIDASFWNTRALQQRQGATASTEKDKGADQLTAARWALQLHQPASPIRQPLQILDFTATAHLKSTTALERFEIGTGEMAEIDIGAAADAGGSHGLIGGAALHHQGHPLRQLGRILAPFHASKGRQCAQLLLTLAQEGHIRCTLHPTDVGHLMQEAGWIQTSLLT